MFKVGDIVECVAEFSNSYDFGCDDCKLIPNHAYCVSKVRNREARSDKGVKTIAVLWLAGVRNNNCWWRTECVDGSPRFKLIDEIYGD